MSYNQIYIGSTSSPTFYFENKDIVSLPVENAIAVAGEELSIDIAEPVVISSNQSGMKAIEYGTPMWIYTDSSLVGKYYIKTVERTATTQWKISGESVVAVLDRQTHFGGIYSGATFENVAEEIFNPYISGAWQEKTYLSSGTTSTKSYAPIDTGFAPTVNTEIQIKFFCGPREASTAQSYANWWRMEPVCGFGNGSTTQNTSGAAIWWMCGSSAASTIEWYKVLAGPASSLYTSAIDMTSVVDNDIEIKWQMTNAGNAIYVNGEKKINSCNVYYTVFDEGYHFYLFWRGSGTTQSGFAYYDRIYWCKIYESGVLVRDFVPVYNRFSSQVGMWDKVENKYYGPSMGSFSSTGTGTSTYTGEYYGIGNDETLIFDDAIKNIPIYGYLPADTKRNNLYQLLFASNVNMIKNANGDLLFTTLSKTPEIEIPSSRIYEGGSVSYGEPAVKVSVAEHSYAYDSSADDVLLFDNSTGTAAARKLVVFENGPYYPSSFTTTGTLSVDAANENSAIVTGIGTLSAKRMSHTTEIVTKETTSPTYSTKEATVDNATLVTALNSDNVLNRVYNWETAATKINTNIVLSGEKCSKYYRLLSPFGDTVRGFLTKLSAVISAKTKANCEFVTEFTPVHSGNNYETAVVLTDSGTWTVPSGVTQFRAVLIGAGNGGSSGCAGTAGATYTSTSGASYTGGDGGAAGTAGTAGKVYQITVSSPSASYVYSCGTGGAGGISNASHTAHNGGSNGTDTTFGSYSSASGAVISGGITNLLTGDIYATAGEGGADGANGPKTTYDSEARSYSIDFQNSSVTYKSITYAMGIQYWNQSVKLPSSGTIKCGANGGVGGGAAIGANGGNGTMAYQQGTDAILYGGSGGAGGSAVARTAATIYGQGGAAGHGGGGGGVGGMAWSNYEPYYYGYSGAGGSGGNGGAGGQGGNGCIIIYY